jgi:hypothetical protein
MRKTHLTQSWDVQKSPSLPLGSELPPFWAPLHALAVAFPFSLINPTLYTGFAHHPAASRTRALPCEGKDPRPQPKTLQHRHMTIPMTPKVPDRQG